MPDTSAYLTGLAAADRRLSDLMACPFPGESESLFAPKLKSVFKEAVAPSDAALSAATAALQSAGIPASRVDFVISCTQTPDLNNPGLVSLLTAKLGMSGTGGLEIRQSGAGALYAIDLARRMVQRGTYSCILVSAADLLSRYFTEFKTRSDISREKKIARAVCADGAAAFLVVSSEIFFTSRVRGGFEIVHSQVFNSGEGAEFFKADFPSSSRFPLRLTAADVEAGLHLPALNPEGFAEFMKGKLGDSFREFRARVNFDTEPESLFTHQLFSGMNEILNPGESFGVSQVSDVFASAGFCGAAGVPLALAEGTAGLNKESSCMLFGCGAGVAWGFAGLKRL